MRYDAYEIRPHRQLDRGVRLQVNERTRSSGCQDGTRYSVEETNQFHGQAQEGEHMGTFSIPRQITVSRLVLAAQTASEQSDSVTPQKQWYTVKTRE